MLFPVISVHGNRFGVQEDTPLYYGTLHGSMLWLGSIAIYSM